MGYLCLMLFSSEILKEMLDEKADRYNTAAFIEDDPICIPHLFSRKEDREIAGLFSATIAWGQRATIIRNATRLMQLMDHSPFDFVMHSSESELGTLEKFTHRTFNGQDARYFVLALRNLYTGHGGLEKVISDFWKDHHGEAGRALSSFRDLFFSAGEPGRTAKHVADPLRGSSAKRLNMFLRWMVRSDGRGVDFGIWKDIPMSQLCCPLDVHTGRIARALGMLRRNSNDWAAVLELTALLREFDPDDPVRYDFALFGMGMYEDLR